MSVMQSINSPIVRCPSCHFNVMKVPAINESIREFTVETTTNYTKHQMMNMNRLFITCPDNDKCEHFIILPVLQKGTIHFEVRFPNDASPNGAFPNDASFGGDSSFSLETHVINWLGITLLSLSTIIAVKHLMSE